MTAPMRTVGVRIPVAAYDQLSSLGQDSGLTPTQIARDLLLRALEGAETEPAGVEAEVRRDLDALVSGHPMGEALAAMAINLARVLDAGAGLIVASVTRELRENLRELAEYEAGGDDDDDFSSGVPASMVNPEDDV